MYILSRRQAMMLASSFAAAFRARSGYEKGCGGGSNLREGFHPCGKQRVGLTIDGGVV